MRKAKCGGVTFVQRFGGSINLNIHFHSLILDGIYYEDANKEICFQRLPPPADAEVARVTACLVKKIHRWRDGTSHVIFDPMDLMGKLAALVPPPRFNLVRYHGILAPAARWRSRIVPKMLSDALDLLHCPDCTVKKKKQDLHGKTCKNPSKSHARNYSWAELMKRVFGLDVLKCDRSGARCRQTESAR